jgi:hypothetical protein
MVVGISLSAVAIAIKKDRTIKKYAKILFIKVFIY